jgi:hypothetical protein
VVHGYGGIMSKPLVTITATAFLVAFVTDLSMSALKGEKASPHAEAQFETVQGPTNGAYSVSSWS